MAVARASYLALLLSQRKQLRYKGSFFDFIKIKVRLKSVFLQISSVEQYAFRSFADALEVIPITLAENCGYSPIHLVTETKSRQILEENPFLGIDCMQEGTSGE